MNYEAKSDSKSRRELTPRQAIRRPFGRSRHLARLAFGLGMAATFVIASVSPAGAITEVHDVESGDSLSLIAVEYLVPLDELAEANDIKDFDQIQVGQVLKIPGLQTYTVRDGDYLSTIALAHGTNVAELVNLNNLKDANVLLTGTELAIPRSAAGTSPAPSNDSVEYLRNYPRLPQRLVDNPERHRLIPVFEKAAEEFDVPPELLMAMAYRESGWQRTVVSERVGAIGIGQLLPSTAEWLDKYYFPNESGLDPFVPEDNIRMSARYLAWLSGYLSAREPSDSEVAKLSLEDRVIASYYQGPGSVNSEIGLYSDTREYISNVNLLRSRFVKK